MTHQTVPGRKAAMTKLFAWGLDEPNRASRHAAWSGDNQGRLPPENNPHSRSAVYSSEDIAREARFRAWNAAYIRQRGGADLSFDDHMAMLRQNPHSNPGAVQRYGA